MCYMRQVTYNFSIYKILYLYIVTAAIIVVDIIKQCMYSTGISLTKRIFVSPADNFTNYAQKNIYTGIVYDHESLTRYFI